MTKKRSSLLMESLCLLAGGALFLGAPTNADTSTSASTTTRLDLFDDAASHTFHQSLTQQEHEVPSHNSYTCDSDSANNHHNPSYSPESHTTCISVPYRSSMQPPAIRIPCPSLSTEEVNDDDSLTSEYQWIAKGTTQLLGLGYDAASIRPKVLSQLLDLNCRQNVELHVLSRHGNEETTAAFEEAQLRCFPDPHPSHSTAASNTPQHSCAPFLFDPDPPSAAAIENRVDRIAYLRDYQRDRAYFLHQENNPESDINPNAFLQNQAVIVVDLDMHYIPTNREILGEVERIMRDDTWDVICAAGLMHHPFGYYDIFATVLEDSTFVYPLAGRLQPDAMKSENASMIRSDPLYGELTQEGLFYHFQEQASQNVDGVVPVQSCFGGLAVYRSSAFFKEGCRYASDPSKFSSFANIEDGTPCEHIIFHDCLRGEDQDTRIAIQPSLNTWWDTPVHLGSYIRPGGRISTGLVERDGLVRSSRRPSSEALQLENGNYYLKISSDGGLVIYDRVQSKAIWRLEVRLESETHGNWDFAFLTLAKDGELILSHQYNDQSCLDCFQYKDTSKLVQKECKPCRKVIWSTGKRLHSGYTTNSFLHLGKDGVLRVVDIRREEVIWQSDNNGEEGLVGYDFEAIIGEIRPSIPRPCIPSGTEQDINLALSGDFAEAKLCPGAIFDLSDTIKFTSSNQALFTEGYPTGEGRAILRIVDKSAVVAINMLNVDHAKLQNVIVDGNREGLKQARGRKYLNALIQAGGRSQGQIISGIEATDTRSWSILHLAEGDDEESCGGALVKENRLGPAGYHRSGAWADGISTACKQSLVRNNTIVDATDVALVLFGGPGSIIEDNHIIANTRIASAGITLVDFGPYDGNFSGSIVRRNTIDARNATIGVGIAMGPRTWQCMNPQDLVNVTLWNATVTENTLRGDHMQYGYAVDGVKNWTVIGNIDQAKHLQGAEELPNDCRSEDSYLSPPAGFQINRNTSSGVFQEEFEDANIEFLIANVIGMRATKCIPSGDQDSINHELTGAFATAVLCPGSVFNLSAPIVFTAPHQAVFTEGKPDDRKKATLRIVDDSVSVAVKMVNQNYAMLSHVVIDGNRPLLGAASSSAFKDAMIQAGGESKGQVIKNVDASNTRSWASLHVAEGDASNRCNNALIENNTIGPSGYYEATQWAVGVSMACKESRVKNNLIHDATDVGLSIFGAPGSTIEGNLISANSTPLRAGISLVDYAPFDGDYRGTVIKNNTIAAVSHPMMVGIAMGPRAWERIDAVDMGDRPIAGARVIANRLDGDFSLHGLYIAGVENWTVTENIRVGSYSEDILASNASVFALDPCTSSGTFQPEFQTAVGLMTHTKSDGCRAIGNRPIIELDDIDQEEETLKGEDATMDPISLDDEVQEASYKIYKRLDSDFPCYRPGKQTTRGFFYAKIPRTGSTTMAGVARRIAAHKGAARNSSCNIRVGHGSPQKKFDYGNRDVEKSFLWTFVREPAERALSSFFYHKVSKMEWEASDKMFMKWADNYESNYQANFLKLQEGDPSVDDILASYDFIGVTERMDESLVALMMILDLEFSDILYLSSKRNGFAFTSDASGALRCIEVIKKHKSKAMMSYFESIHWKDTNKKDMELFRTANLSLDKTIESLGEDVFRQNLSMYRAFLQFAEEKCSSSVVFPCASVGSPNMTESCYARDEGCGYNCLDRLMEEFEVPQGSVLNPISAMGSSIDEQASFQEQRVVWLMSFPNSGTSYTQRVSATLSGISTATNYGVESKGEMESVFRGSKKGPFWVPSAYDRPDDELILTKTHCGGYCIACPPREYLMTSDGFLKSCRKYNTGQTSGNTWLEYDLGIVRKSVHLFRDPFDNVVSRFNHERKNRFAIEGITKYSDGPEDFRLFCREYVDARSHKKGFTPPVDIDTWETLLTVPCHTDFLRYINWHNHASAVLKENAIPSLVIHYEDYGTNWNATVTSLLEFLEQSPEGSDPATFRSGKTYRHYYFEHEIEAVREVFEKVASASTWTTLSRYFDNGEESVSSSEGNGGGDVSVTTNDEIDLAPLEVMEACDYETVKASFGVSTTSEQSDDARDNNDLSVIEIPVEVIEDIQDTENWVWTGEGNITVGALRHPGGTTCQILIRMDGCFPNGSNSTAGNYNHEKCSAEAQRNSLLSRAFFQAAISEGIELNGFLPVWGDLVTTKQGTNGIMPLRVGSVMPVIPSGTRFEVFDSLLEASCSTDFPTDPIANARLWMPLAKTLATAEEFGLYFQDISGRSVGILSSENEQVAVLHNTTFLTRLESTKCKKDGHSFDFCRIRDAFAPKSRPAFSDEMVIQKDCERFLHLVFLALKQGRITRRPEEERVARVLFESLDGLKYQRGQCTFKSLSSKLNAFIEEFQVYNTQSVASSEKDERSGHDRAQPCSYDALRGSFKTEPLGTGTENQTCWSLEEEILRVPAGAILKPNNLPLLGRGSQGVVHEANIQLTDGSICSVAIKGDKCRNVRTNEKFVSCISPHAVRMETAQSVVDSEYIGALLFHAALKAGEDLPGFLPTWGLVYDDEGGDDIASLKYGPPEKALIMPIVNFESLDSILASRRKDDILPNPASMAEMMLPVLDTLMFVESLGMSFQDVHKKNIGVIASSGNSNAFVFDSTYLTFLDYDRCDIVGNRTACNFCMEAKFFKKKRNVRFTDGMVRLKECKNIVNTFLFYFEKTDRVEEPLWQTLDSIMYSFEDCSLGSVKVALEDYLSQKKARETASLKIAEMDIRSRLPFIFEIADFDIISNQSGSLEYLAWERTAEWRRSSSRTGVDVSFDFDDRVQNVVPFDEEKLIENVQSFLAGLKETCHGIAKDNAADDFQWVVQPTTTHAGTGFFSGHSVYVESNGTVTVALDTCKEIGDTRKFFTLIQAENGCTNDECNFRAVQEYLLSPPFPCALNHSLPSYGCPCALETPSIWFDKPLQKWRLLMNQVQSYNVEGSCIFNSFAHSNSGGYAESLGTSLGGAWKYDFFDSAYGNEIRHSEEEGWRLLEYKHLVNRTRPRVVLGETGGLDGGFLFNDVCEWDGYEHITNYTKELLCGKRLLGVARSTSTARQRASGTIYIQYHAETGNKTYPEANGPRGKARARHWITQFNDKIFKAPRTIIAPLVEDYKKRRGQRLRDSVTPLANHLGVEVTIGPTLVDSPRWTAEPATQVALMALDSLNEGTVTVSYWSFTWELCEKIGTKCDEFDEPGQFNAIHLVDGKVVSVENKLFDNFGDDVFWHQLNETSKENWSALGWDEESWDEAEKPKKRKWNNLDIEQQSAALSLGFNETTWNANCTYMQILVPEDLQYCNI